MMVSTSCFDNYNLLFTYYTYISIENIYNYFRLLTFPLFILQPTLFVCIFSIGPGELILFTTISLISRYARHTVLSGADSARKQ